MRYTVGLHQSNAVGGIVLKINLGGVDPTLPSPNKLACLSKTKYTIQLDSEE